MITTLSMMVNDHCSWWSLHCPWWSLHCPWWSYALLTISWSFMLRRTVIPSCYRHSSVVLYLKIFLAFRLVAKMNNHRPSLNHQPMVNHKSQTKFNRPVNHTKMQTKKWSYLHRSPMFNQQKQQSRLTTILQLMKCNQLINQQLKRKVQLPLIHRKMITRTRWGIEANTGLRYSKAFGLKRWKKRVPQKRKRDWKKERERISNRINTVEIRDKFGINQKKIPEWPLKQLGSDKNIPANKEGYSDESEGGLVISRVKILFFVPKQIFRRIFDSLLVPPYLLPLH